METTQQIVVPVDFTKGTEVLVSYAISMAEKLAAVIHYVHVVQDFPGDAMIGSPFAQDYQDKVTAVSQERMADLVENSQKSCPGSAGQVLFGDPVDHIIEFSRTKNADLIIIGSHGARGLEKMILGRVADRVLKGAHCPVLIMNPFKELQSDQYRL